jgi:hypothetical protein
MPCSGPSPHRFLSGTGQGIAITVFSIARIFFPDQRKESELKKM